MREGIPVKGLDAQSALWRLLAARGKALNLQALRERLPGPLVPERLARELRGLGMEAQAIVLQEGDLDHLALPTLAQLRDGTWMLVRRRRTGAWEVELGGGGVVRLGRKLLDRVLAGPALDIAEPFPAKGRLWDRAGRLLLTHRKALAQAAVITLFAQALALVPPWLTGTVIDQSLGLGAPSLLAMLCLGLVVSAFCQAWVGWLRETTLLALGSRFEASLEKGLFRHLLALPFPYLERRTLGQLIQAFKGLRGAQSLLLEAGPGALFSGVAAAGYLLCMAILLPVPAAVVLLAALLYGGIALAMGTLQAREQWLEIEAGQAEYSALVELISGTATLKATASQEWAQGRWAQRLDQVLRHSLRRGRLGLWAEGGNEFLTLGLVALMMIWGGFKVLAGELTLGGLMVFAQLTGAYAAAVSSMVRAAVSFLVLRPQLKAVSEAFEQELPPQPPRKGAPDWKGALEVQDVWFRYGPEAPWILEGVTLRVEAGTFHHLPGPSGSGKSTLLKLVAGLYSPIAGSIRFGGLDPISAGPCLAYLPQFPQLFSGSILENLRLFSAGATHDRLMEVAHDTGLHDWVETLPMGYQTVVAQGGENLSGGQRQLVTLTAVLASDRRILLLDEALSNLDWVSRTRILASAHFRERTVLYASHEETFHVAE